MIKNEDGWILYYIHCSTGYCGEDGNHREFYESEEKALEDAHLKAQENANSYDHSDECDCGCEEDDCVCGFDDDEDMSSGSAEVYDPEEHDMHFYGEFKWTKEAPNSLRYELEIAAWKEKFDKELDPSFFGDEREWRMYSGTNWRKANTCYKCRANNERHALVRLILRGEINITSSDSELLMNYPDVDIYTIFQCIGCCYFINKEDEYKKQKDYFLKVVSYEEYNMNIKEHTDLINSLQLSLDNYIDIDIHQDVEYNVGGSNE